MMSDVGRRTRSRGGRRESVGETTVGIGLIVVAALEIAFLIRVVQANTPRG